MIKTYIDKNHTFNAYMGTHFFCSSSDLAGCQKFEVCWQPLPHVPIYELMGLFCRIHFAFSMKL